MLWKYIHELTCMCNSTDCVGLPPRGRGAEPVQALLILYSTYCYNLGRGRKQAAQRRGVTIWQMILALSRFLIIWRAYSNNWLVTKICYYITYEWTFFHRNPTSNSWAILSSVHTSFLHEKLFWFWAVFYINWRAYSNSQLAAKISYYIRFWMNFFSQKSDQ